MSDHITERLEYLRQQIDDECISMMEIMELQDYGERGLIPLHELKLLQWAGVDEDTIR